MPVGATLSAGFGGSFDHAGSYRYVGDGIDENETAGCTIFPIGIEEQGQSSFDIYLSNIVYMQDVSRNIVQSVYVDAMQDFLNASAYRTSGMLQHVEFLLPAGFSTQPNQVALKRG